MKSKLAIIIILVITVAFILCVQKEVTPEPTEILNSVKENVLNLSNFRAESYSLKVMNCKVNYTFTIDVINGKEIIRFKEVNSTCEKLLYRRLNEALKNAVLIDEGDYYYLYMPSVSSVVAKYRSQNSIIRYKGLPIVTFYNLVSTFDKIESCKYLGKVRVELNGSTIEADQIRYNFTDNLLGNVSVEICIYQKIPIQARLIIPKYNATIITVISSYEFGKAKDFNLSAYEIVERN